MSNDDAIVVSNLSKRFRRFHKNRPASLKEAVLRGFKGLGTNEEFWGLRDVSFRIPKGKMVGVVGQNGAGKSTLLRLIGGVGKPTRGSIAVNGHIGALLDLTAGFHPDLTGRENVFVSGVICGLTRREVAQRMNDIVAFAELENFIDNPIRTFSTGMQMRLGFAVAIHTDPDILLIDEVLAVGDLSFQQKCLERIKSFKARGCTILLISHDLAQVEQFCDEAIWLRRGELVAHGSPEVLVGEYTAELASETRRRTPASQPPVVTPHGTLLRVNQNRFGSMEVEITAVDILDADGHAVKQLGTGQPISIAIGYCATKPVVGPVFSVTISREDGFVCLDTNTALQALQLPTVAGRGKVMLCLDRLDLQRGKYFVDVGIYEKDWAYGYDYHWHVYPLEILGPPGDGVLNPPQCWQFHADKAAPLPGSSGRPELRKEWSTT